MIEEAVSHVAHLLPAYAAGTLAPAQHLHVQTHLAGCRACQMDLAAWQTIQRATPAVYAPNLPEADDVLSQAHRRLAELSAPGDVVSTPDTWNVLPARHAPMADAPRHVIASVARRSVEGLAVAALIALVLIGSLAVLGPGRSWQWDRVSPSLPAVSGTPSPPQTVTTRTLLDVLATNLPAGSPRVVVDRWRLQPSTTDVVLPAHDGAVFVMVDMGTITVRVGGVDHQLAVGDVLEVTGHEFAFRAVDSGPAVAYLVSITSELSTAGGQSHARIWISGDPHRHTMDFVLSSSAEDFPDGNGHVVLEEVSIPPGSALLPQTTQPFMWTEVGTGVLGLTLDGEHLPFRWKPGTERTFRYGEYLPYLRPGTRMTLRNAGDTPLVLYRLTLRPGDATPATSPSSPTVAPQSP